MDKPIGILGGTFNPVHFGHLRLGLEIYQTLQLKEIRFIPCYIPVHKPSHTTVSAAHRLKMLELALTHQTYFMIDPREIERNTPSYSIDTLISLRQHFPETPLCLIIGSDAFLELPTWHRWQELIHYAHIVVGLRPGYEISVNTELEHFLMQCHTKNSKDLHEKLNGLVYFQTITSLAISATKIREQISLGLNPSYLLPHVVYEYILENRLYV